MLGSLGGFWGLFRLWLTFQDRHLDAAHQIGDQIERCDRQSGQARHTDDDELSENPRLMEEFTAFELKRVPAETFHEPFNVVDGSSCIGDIP